MGCNAGSRHFPLSSRGAVSCRSAIFAYYESIEPDRSRNVRALPRIALIVPVRNEAANVVGCLKGWLGQDYPPNLLELIVVDDGSTDGTANIVQRLAHDTRRIRSIKAGDLPVGWMGKPHACWRGATAVDAEWLCFIDADTRANEAPDAKKRDPVRLRAEARHAFARAFQELTGFLDRLVFPLGSLGDCGNPRSAARESSGYRRGNRERPVHSRSSDKLFFGRRPFRRPRGDLRG